jgi:hypothetical protein
VAKACVFCGTKATLTNAHVLSQPIRAAFSDPSVTGSFVYRQSRQADGSHAAHSHSGSWVAHVLRVGSPEFIKRVSPAGPALSPCLLTIWPTQNPLIWPPRSLAAMGGLMGLARSIDNTGIAIV